MSNTSWQRVFKLLRHLPESTSRDVAIYHFHEIPLTDMTADSRHTSLRKARWVETASLGYNAIEVGVSLTAGFLIGSSALISWGVDSFVEGISAATLIWRLRGEEKGASQAVVQQRKKIALTVLSGAFTFAALFIVYEAVAKLLAGTTPQFSWVGLTILVVSLLVNPLLAWGKYRYGKRLDSSSLKYDAIDTLICQYQTVVVLLGVILSQTMGWWWADPVAALLIVPYVAKEAVGAGRKAWRVDPSDSDQHSGPGR